jgi:Na+-transporting NADH:ubiquinone oxidoreductase subunit C
MSDMLKSIRFAAITALVSSLLLTGASSGLREYRLKNIRIDNQKNLLKSAGLIQTGKTYSGEEIEKLYREKIRSLQVDENGHIFGGQAAGKKGLPIFLSIEKESIQAYILPVHSRGLWGKIEGYLALKNDGATIAGFTVYSHGETPGLGGEIQTEWFQKNFRGKKIVDRKGEFAAIGIAKGRVAGRIPKGRQENFVDGISGATLTGRFLSEGLRDTLITYEKVSTRFREGGIKLKTVSAGEMSSQ